jgi:glycosyltransferase involved in cell wall biosynthesis
MKIALLTHHFPPRYNAGAEQYAYRIAHGLRRQGHMLDVVCIESITDGSLIPTCATDDYEGLSVHRLHYDIRKAPSRFEWSFRNPDLGHWIGLFLLRTRPDLVHINSGYLLGGTTAEASFGQNIPTVLTLHDYWFTCPLITLLRMDGRICRQPAPPARCVWCLLSEKRRYRLLDIQLYSRLGGAFVRLNRLETLSKLMGVTPLLELVAERRAYLKRVLEAFDAVISPSRFLIQKVEECGLQPRRMVHLPFGLEQAHLSRPEPNTPPAKLRIGYLGQFGPHKGVHLLLAAFRKLTKHPGSCELTLHGRISDATPYERKLLRIARRDPAIAFAGPYPNHEVGQVLNDLDVIVVPSLWYENRPTVIVEAQANRTPVVATRLGGMAELVEHNENGLLFRKGSIEGLTEQLQRLLDEPTLLPRLQSGIRAVPTVEEEMATLISVYESLL